MNHIKILGKTNFVRTVINKKKLNFIIFLHLYNISQLDEWIESLNTFYELNQEHNISLYINIPIGDNLENYNAINCDDLTIDNIFIYDCQNLLNENNATIIKAIIATCILKIKIKPHFIVSENKGVDIGGFIHFLKIMKLKTIKCDFVIKLHTKSKDTWRLKLCKILHVTHVEEQLKQYDMIASMVFRYPNPSHLYEKETNDFNIRYLCNKFKIDYQDTFRFVPGTMFMCSWKVVQKLLDIDLDAAYNDLNDMKTKDKNWMRIMKDKIIFEHHCKNNNVDPDSNNYVNFGNNFALQKINKNGIRDGQIEHGWERVFGLIVENLSGKFLIIY
jgi:hypothetical protein